MEGKGRVSGICLYHRSHHSILYLPPKEESLPGFVPLAAGNGSHRVRDRISAEKDTKESVKLKGQKNSENGGMRMESQGHGQKM